MKIVPQSATLLSITPDAEKLLEAAGRTAYKSEDKITDTSALNFVRMVLKRNHESVIEHASATFRIICDRGISHEIVRHRLCSYTQESTRFVNYSNNKFGGEITVIRPPGLSENAAADSTWQAAMISAEHAYFNMLNSGCTPQIARSVLPTCLKTEIVMTANFRNWKHFLKLRTAPDAHPQIREVANIIRDIMVREAPAVFAPKEG